LRHPQLPKQKDRKAGTLFFPTLFPAGYGEEEGRMTVEVTHTALPGGYDYYCPGCDLFFSVSGDKVLPVKYCPVCGWDTLIRDKETFEAAYPVKAGRLSA
jgi:hypothetical protein